MSRPLGVRAKQFALPETTSRVSPRRLFSIVVSYPPHFSGPGFVQEANGGEFGTRFANREALNSLLDELLEPNGRQARRRVAEAIRDAGR
jgi:hypothetical protein